MSLPDKCPFCDAGPGPYVNSYLCGTYLRAGVDARKHQTKRCVTGQMYAWVERARKAEARCRRLEEAGDAMLSAWLMPEDSMSYSDWVCLSSDAKSGWYAAKEAKP